MGQFSHDGEKAESRLSELFERAGQALALQRAQSLEQRLSLLAPLKNQLHKNQDSILTVLQETTGKSRYETLVGEIYPTLSEINRLEKQAICRLRTVSSLPTLGIWKKTQCHFEALGIVFIIGSDNYPLFQGLIPALAAVLSGNAVIYLASASTPFKGHIETLLAEALFPKNLIQIVYGDEAYALELIRNKPQKVFFSGSLGYAKKVLETASGHLIPVTLTLQGHNSMIVLEDANLSQASAAAVWGGLAQAGKTPRLLDNLYVHTRIYDSFKSKLLERLQHVTLGNDERRMIDLGRVSNRESVSRIKELLVDAESRGGRLVCGHEWDRQSFLVPPLVLENVPSDAKIFTTVRCGPLLVLNRLDKLDDVIKTINHSDCVGHLSIWTTNEAQAQHISVKFPGTNVSVNSLENGCTRICHSNKEGHHERPSAEKLDLREFTYQKTYSYQSSRNRTEIKWFPYTEKKFFLFERLTNLLYTPRWYNIVKFIYYYFLLKQHQYKVQRTLERY